MIILSPVGPYYEGGLAPTKLYVEDVYVRAAAGGTGEAKCGGNYAGSLKAQEIAQLVKANDVELLVMDNELSPSQARALEDIMGCRVMDRSGLILDIFAQRAQTREGKLQVELAQYQYLLPRLSGMGKSLSRQGGGIGLVQRFGAAAPGVAGKELKGICPQLQSLAPHGGQAPGGG